ncbi:hypothetical protein HAX54_004941, partial [Datura stramonium]|nr:hypothetical protein [Datura stramonium]
HESTLKSKIKGRREQHGFRNCSPETTAGSGALVHRWLLRRMVVMGGRRGKNDEGDLGVLRPASSVWTEQWLQLRFTGSLRQRSGGGMAWREEEEEK